jgi:cytochrome b
MALRNLSRPLNLPMRVWDAPTRLFHWTLVVLIVVSYVAIRENWMTVHLTSGYLVLTLLLFRIVWGLIGSETSRFRSFLGNPLTGLQHLGRLHVREPDTQVGHNAACGWMVLVMLALLAVQVGTGLCANDGGATEGPLVKYVGKQDSDWLSGIHAWNFNILLGAIILHIVAVGAYAVFKRHDLVRPMITGKKRLPAATRAPSVAHPLKALGVLVLAGAAVWVIATRI